MLRLSAVHTAYRNEFMKDTSGENLGIPALCSQMQAVYNAMGDQRSKEIFTARMLFSLTGDHKYIDLIARNHTQVTNAELLHKIMDSKLRGK